MTPNDPAAFGRPENPLVNRTPAFDASQVLAALGGAANIRHVSANSSRVCLDLVAAERISESALRSAGIRSMARVEKNTVHLIVGPIAPAMLAALKT